MTEPLDEAELFKVVKEMAPLVPYLSQRTLRMRLRKMHERMGGSLGVRELGEIALSLRGLRKPKP